MELLSRNLHCILALQNFILVFLVTDNPKRNLGRVAANLPQMQRPIALSGSVLPQFSHRFAFSQFLIRRHCLGTIPRPRCVIASTHAQAPRQAKTRLSIQQSRIGLTLFKLARMLRSAIFSLWQGSLPEKNTSRCQSRISIQWSARCGARLRGSSSTWPRLHF